MAESMPGTMSIFGNAYQAMLASQGRGGGLTGQAAVAALLEAVPTGNVRSADLLPFVAEEMRRRAAPKLEVASGTSMAWQGRLGGMRTDWAAIASESGLEEGQMKWFRWMTQWMNENRDIAERFGSWWNTFTENMVTILSYPAMLEDFLAGGDDNPFERWLGEGGSEEFRKAWKELSEIVGPLAEDFKNMYDINLVSVLKGFTEILKEATVMLNNTVGMFKGGPAEVASRFGNRFTSGMKQNFDYLGYLMGGGDNPTVVQQYGHWARDNGVVLPRSRREVEQRAAEWYAERGENAPPYTSYTARVEQYRRSEEGIGNYLSSVSSRQSQPMMMLNIGDVSIQASGASAEDVAEGFVDGIIERFENRLSMYILPDN